MEAIPPHELERIQALASLFPTDTPLSSDLQQHIIDFLFPRLNHEIEKDGKKKCFKLHLAIKNGKHYYHLYVVVDNNAMTLSSLSIEKSEMAKLCFNKFTENDCQTPYYDVGSEVIVIYSSYFFCSKDGKTYKLEAYQNKKCIYAHIFQLPQVVDKDLVSARKIKSLIIGIFSDVKSAYKKLLEYRPVIDEYMNLYWLYPHDGRVYNHPENYLSCYYIWPKDDVFVE